MDTLDFVQDNFWASRRAATLPYNFSSLFIAGGYESRRSKSSDFASLLLEAQKLSCTKHFGSTRNLKEKLSEIKFNDGRRIYYTIIPEDNVILLLGGNKNGQKKDIEKARKILKREQKS